MIRLKIVVGVAAACFLTDPGFANEARFFRVLSSSPATVTAVTALGHVTWTNGQTGITCTIQTSTNPFGGWVDFVQVPVTNHLMSVRLFDPTPPSGMALIPSGTFTMGDSLDEIDGTMARPTHPVNTTAFYMDRFEVTKALWDEVYQWATNHGYNFSNPGSGKAPNHPVHVVSWFDMVKWCNARSEKEGREPAYYTSVAQNKVYRTGPLGVQSTWVKWNAGYRLPTEAEWEKAARGGQNGKRFPWGSTISHAEANYFSSIVYLFDTSLTRGYAPLYDDGTAPNTSPVGSFAPNGYGLYDMAGNVWEWCWDWYDQAWYASGNATQEDTRGPTTASGVRAIRGGAWFNIQLFSQCANRHFYFPSYGLDSVGFRCVRGI